MRALHLAPLSLVILSAALGGCGDTGGLRFSFAAAAAGPEGSSGSMSFDTASGYHVTLSRARVHVGAVYLNESVPTSGAQGTSCYLPGRYVAQVTAGLDVDALSGAARPFPVEGEAITVPAAMGEVWLTGGRIDVIEDTTVILDVAGEAERGGERWPFDGTLTIGSNRSIPAPSPVLPGANPICKQRIAGVVFPPGQTLTPSPGGTLLLRAVPRAWFDGVDFSTLARVSDAPPRYRFADAPVAPADISLFGGLRSRAAWDLTWKENDR